MSMKWLDAILTPEQDAAIKSHARASFEAGRYQQRTSARGHDIKAPDGYLLGGIRRVRKGGVVLFQRDYHQAPLDWAGQDIWVHDAGAYEDGIHAAPPGQHIYAAMRDKTSIRLAPIDRMSAKPGYRRAEHKAWAARSVTKATGNG